MKVHEDGKYELNDGRILTSEEVTQLYKRASEKREPKKDPKILDLKEGQSSGPIQLHD